MGPTALTWVGRALSRELAALAILGYVAAIDGCRAASVARVPLAKEVGGVGIAGLRHVIGGAQGPHQQAPWPRPPHLQGQAAAGQPEPSHARLLGPFNSSMTAEVR
jgi:hypothetical protein